MFNDLKSHYTTMLNELLDYLDSRCCCTYHYNKEETIFEIKQEAIATAEKGVPSTPTP